MGAVLAALFTVALLLLMAVMYVKCRLNVLLWYRNRHGEVEINGKYWAGELAVTFPLVRFEFQ